MDRQKNIVIIGNQSGRTVLPLGWTPPDWSGDYWVRYWDADWQSIIYGSPDSYLDKILDLGFDGVFLDRVDACRRSREHGYMPYVAARSLGRLRINSGFEPD